MSLRTSLFFGLGASLLVACSSGGDSTSSTGTTSSGGAAGASQGGSSQGGSSQGGSTSGGASQAGAGGLGQGGSTDDCCATVKCAGAHPICVAGGCFDLKPGECFSASDCGGAACLGATICPCDAVCVAGTKPGTCAGQASAWAACGAPGDCALAANTCCGTCGKPSAADLDAVNKTKLKAHQSEVCPTPQPCPKCASMPNPDLLAACALGPGTCAVLQVSKSPLSACKVDDDCTLRAPQCCSCGEQPAEGLAAIAKAQLGAYMAELGCGNVSCAPCADPPTPPAGVHAVCDAGHCKLAGP
ncbi:MAG: hypothetical protein IT374_07775 [Polyangiaceae bacterium]|nr:hypothetical protein [Polyangiaceae bacterium]